MAINFPAVTSLNDGHQEILDSKLYTLHKTSNSIFFWSASQADNSDDRYVNVTGDNMTGSLGGVTTFRSTNMTDGSTTRTMTQVLAGSSALFCAGSITGDATQSFTGLNIASVDRPANGNFDITFTNAAPNTRYVVLATSTEDGNQLGNMCHAPESQKQTTGFRIIRSDTNSSGINRDFNFAVYLV